MPCRTIRSEDGKMTGIICSRNGPAKTCRFCREKGRKRKATKLCDFKLGAYVTCDAPMCDFHATPVAPEKDLCPPHNARWEKIKANRREKNDVRASR